MIMMISAFMAGNISSNALMPFLGIVIGEELLQTIIKLNTIFCWINVYIVTFTVLHSSQR